MRDALFPVPRGLVLLLLALWWAQGTARGQEQPPAVASSAELRSEYEELTKEFQEAQQAYFKAYAELQTEEQREAFLADEARNPSNRFAPRFRALAERAGEDAVAASAMLWLLRSTLDAQTQQELVDRLLAGFLHAPEIAELARFLELAERTLGRKPAVAALRTIRKRSEDPQGRLAATLTLGIVQLGGKSPTVQSEGRSLLLEVLSAAPGTPSAARARGELFEFENLRIGMIAPDIEGLDSAGKPFKLSDYRGQVVVIDFWGFW